MAITRNPTPVDVTTSSTAVPLSQIDRAPAPVDVPTVTQTVPRSQVDRAPATVSTSSDPGLSPTTITVSRPLTTLSSSGNASANTDTPLLITVESNTLTNVNVATPLYLTVSDEGAVVLNRTNYINFVGSGVTVTNTNGTATVDISGGGGGHGGNVNINAGESADPAGVAGNVYITAGPSQVWTFNNTGTLTAPGNISANNIGLSGNITSLVSVTDPTALASLTPINGARAFAIDANLVATGNFGAQVSGGGSNTVPVWSDGANWYIG